MSSPIIPLVLAREASDDFAAILQHTLETWGDMQADAYRDVIDGVLQAIARHPKIGRRVSDFGKGFRIFPAGSHIVIYEVKPDALYVHRVLHSRMDIAGHLPEARK